MGTKAWSAEMPIRSIPWAQPTLWGREEEYVVEALRSTWISGGPYVTRLEDSVAAYLGTRHAIAVANGTAALHLVYLAIGVKPGDEIVVSGFGFMAAANLAVQLGAIPIFCDVNPETWCMQADQIRPLLTPATKAIVVVHNYGNVCEMDAILELAGEAGIPVIEDTAEAFGSRLNGRQAGTMGKYGTFSFHATKTISTGEGGLVITDDDDAAALMRLYRSHGLMRRRHYWHEVPGHNFRLTNLQAALGCAQMEFIDAIAKERQRVMASYQANLGGLANITLQKLSEGCAPLIWAVAVRLEPSAFQQGRNEVMLAMQQAGIETRPGFEPPSQMPYFEPARLAVSEELGQWVISLPTYPSLPTADVDQISSVLKSLAAGK